MMLKSLSFNKERKILLAVGAVLLVLGAVYRFYPDIRAMVSVSEEMALRQKQVDAYAGIVAQKKQVEKENALAKRLQNQMNTRFLPGATPSLAAVEIQNILNRIAGASNVKFATMRVMKPVEDENSGFIRLPVQFSMTSSIVQLRDMIYKIEASPKLLVITELDASQSRSRDQAAMIRATVTVEGVMQTGGGNTPVPPKKAG